MKFIWLVFVLLQNSLAFAHPSGEELSFSQVVSLQKSVDSDGDGVSNFRDNCKGAYNPDQLDSDKDGFGDICQVTPNSAIQVELLPPEAPQVPIQVLKQEKFQLKFQIRNGGPRVKTMSYLTIDGLAGLRVLDCQSTVTKNCKKVQPRPSLLAVHLKDLPKDKVSSITVTLQFSKPLCRNSVPKELTLTASLLVAKNQIAIDKNQKTIQLHTSGTDTLPDCH
jgi:hypothetical protein